ncbi:cystatin-A-like [Cloeon dipterum]|uniref:cystatin-A-like n=1 Tax=Cloeon dipterum TaxID=197152 RepID=UPI00321FA317
MSRVVCGGAAPARDASDEVQNVCDRVKPRVEQILGTSLTQYRALKYRPQTVAGINYFVKVDTGNGNFLHLRIYKNLKGEVELSGLQEGKTELEEIEYFERHLNFD